MFTKEGEEENGRAERIAKSGASIEQYDEESGADETEQEAEGAGEEDAAEGPIEEEGEGEKKVAAKPEGKQEGEEVEEIEDEVIVTIGDEEVSAEEDAGDSSVIREMRKRYKEQQKENRELQRRLEEREVKKASEELGPEPTFENSGFDEDVFKQRFIDWSEKKRAKDLEEAERKKAEEAEQKAWNEKLAIYNEKKAKFKAGDYGEAEDAARAIFNMNQQGIIVDVAENPEVVVYYLGKHPEKAKELASLSLAKFSAAIGALEPKLKVESKKPSTAPEKRVAKGTASVTGSMDSILEKLRAEADKTSDYSKVAAYKRKLREKG